MGLPARWPIWELDSRSAQRSEHFRHLLPADAHQEGVVAAVGLDAEDVETGLGVGEGLDAVGALGEAVAASGAEEGGGELHRAAGGVALVDLELAVEIVVADV